MRHKILLTLAVVFAAVVSGFAQPKVVLRNGNVVDVKSGELLVGYDVVIVDGKIKSIAKNRGKAVASDEVDLTGKYLIPALIDGHTHLANFYGWNAEWTGQFMKSMVESGILTVRDACGDVRIIKAIQDKVSKGQCVAPDIYTSAFVAGESYYEGNDREADMTKGWATPYAPWLVKVTADSDPDTIAREAKEWGCTSIKLYGGLDASQIKLLSQAAHKHGLKVVAHATLFPGKPLDCAENGVNTIAHAYLLDWQGADGALDGSMMTSMEKYSDKIERDKINFEPLITACKENNVFLDPTVFLSVENKDKYADKFMMAMYKGGVKISAGTDYMDGDKASRMFLFEELETYVKSGMAVADALRSATIWCAESIGIEKSKGSLESGKIADILVLNSNPLEDIKNLKDIKLIIRQGVELK